MVERNLQGIQPQTQVNEDNMPDLIDQDDLLIINNVNQGLIESVYFVNSVCHWVLVIEFF